MGVEVSTQARAPLHSRAKPSLQDLVSHITVLFPVSVSFLPMQLIANPPIKEANDDLNAQLKELGQFGAKARLNNNLR